MKKTKRVEMRKLKGMIQRKTNPKKLVNNQLLRKRKAKKHLLWNKKARKSLKKRKMSQKIKLFHQIQKLMMLKLLHSLQIKMAYLSMSCSSKKRRLTIHLINLKLKKRQALTSLNATNFSKTHKLYLLTIWRQTTITSLKRLQV